MIGNLVMIYLHTFLPTYLPTYATFLYAIFISTIINWILLLDFLGRRRQNVCAGCLMECLCLTCRYTYVYSLFIRHIKGLNLTAVQLT